MLEFFVVLGGLVIALSEKPHLFKRPFKWKQISLLILLVFIAVVSLYKEEVNSIDQDKAYKTIDSLKIRSQFLAASVDALQLENRLAHSAFHHQLDSSYKGTIAILAEYGLTVDTLSNAIKKIDTSVSRDVEPVIRLSRFSIEPARGGTENSVHYSVEAFNSNAYITSIKYLFVNLVDDAPTGEIIKKEGGIMDVSVITKDDLIHKNVFLSGLALSDTSLFVVEVTYSSYKGKMQKPIRIMARVSEKNKWIDVLLKSEYSRFSRELSQRGIVSLD